MPISSLALNFWLTALGHSDSLFLNHDVVKTTSKSALAAPSIWNAVFPQIVTWLTPSPPSSLCKMSLSKWGLP